MKRIKLSRLFVVLLSALMLFAGLSGAFAQDWPKKEISASKYPVEKDGSYTSFEEVAVYLATYGKLPGNFLTKNEAERLGWDSRSGNLNQIAPGKSIGGSHFGNYEGLLPKGSWTECDVNYDGGYRGSERILFSKDGLIYYTNDHYNTFTLIVVSFDEDAQKEEPEWIEIPPELMDSLDQYGEYDKLEDVAAYLERFGELPCNYLSKSDAKELGWSSKKDNLNKIMPGCSIGGDVFENREKLLPADDNRIWYECDVNTVDGKRSNEKIIYSNDGLIYYTPDNHITFIEVK